MIVVEINRGQGPQRVVTYLTEDEMKACGGIPPEAVVGLLSDDGELAINSVFREYLHEAIGLIAPMDPGMQQAARNHADGRLVYVDARVPETVQPVPSEDIIGWFQVLKGQLVAGSYEPNPDHRVQGEHGFTAVLDEMRDVMAQELVARSTET